MTPGVNCPVSGTAMTAASAPSSAASTQVNVDSRRTLMPTSSVAVGSWLAPMMASPRLVLVKNRPEHDGQHGERPDQPQPLVRDLHAEDRDPVEGRERPRDRPPLVVEEPLLEGDGEQRHAGGGHEHDDPGRLEQRADDDALGQEAEQHPRQQRADARRGRTGRRSSAAGTACRWRRRRTRPGRS